jgi:hypothetical protein
VTDVAAPAVPAVPAAPGAPAVAAVAGLQVLPTEVELAVRIQACLAERRTYERADRAHPCEFFADQGSFHAYDLRTPSAPATPTTLQPVRYAGRRRIVPELLSGCRKAPIMAVGINPNLPAFWPGKHNSLQPVFDDLLQYVHHYRFRAIGKLEIEPEAYAALLHGRKDLPAGGPELAPVGTDLPVQLSNQAMYEAYQGLLDGLAAAAGWTGARLSVGEDLSYGNMIACGSPRWITQPDPARPGLPVMTRDQRDGIVDECFTRRRYFLRQLFHSLPRVLLVFGGATRDAMVSAMAGHFTAGAPQLGEDLDALLARRVVLRYGELPGGHELAARVIFVPHASGNPDGFAVARAKVIAALHEEVDGGALALDAASGHLVRSVGACAFCDNALYRIAACDYASQLVPLAQPPVAPASEPRPARQAAGARKASEAGQARAASEAIAEDGAQDSAGTGLPPALAAIVRERAVQDTLLAAWLGGNAP